jgi:hypothetical protein
LGLKPEESAGKSLSFYEKAKFPEQLNNCRPAADRTLIFEYSKLVCSGGVNLSIDDLSFIGKLDRTLEPMIPSGSIVQIDTKRRAISSRKDWTHEFQRPIYFLMTREGYVCGWCELDKNSEWLTLLPHPLSPASSRRWKYRTEIENIGRVIAVAIRLAP